MPTSRNKLHKAFIAIFALCICAGVLMCVSVKYNFSTNISKLGGKPATELATGWSQETSSGSNQIILPSKIYSADDTASISRILTATKDTCLLVQTSQQTLTAYLNGEEIYSGGQLSHTTFGYALGTAYHVIRIPQDVNYTKLTLEFTNQLPKSSFTQKPIYMGSETDINMWIIRDNFGVLIFCITMAVVGVLLIIADVLVHFAGHVHHDVGLSYVGIFSIISAFWIFSDCIMFQFSSDNLAFLYTMSYISFMLIPMPLLLYLHAMVENGRKAVSLLASLTMLNYFVTMILFFAGIPLPYLLFTTHAVIIVLFVVAIFICTKTDESASAITPSKEIMYGLMSLCASGFLALVSFYLDPTGKYILWFCIGIAIFITLLVIGSIHKSILIIHTGVENAEFNRIAYMDTLTELGNRTAFERENRSKYSSTNTAVFSMDICDMRGINRVHGYDAGNEILHAFARCMTKAGADCNYRIGSDEFAAVLYDARPMDITRYVARLEECVKDYNAHAIVPLKYKIGNASGGKETTLLKLLDDADSMRRVRK